MDILEAEFETAYAAFLAAGGLDATHIISEDWERDHFRTCCPHRVQKALCAQCSPKKSSAYPYMGYGSGF